MFNYLDYKYNNLIPPQFIAPALSSTYFIPSCNNFYSSSCTTVPKSDLSSALNISSAAPVQPNIKKSLVTKANSVSLKANDDLGSTGEYFSVCDEARILNPAFN